ncbi:hypothetical protein LPJ66_012032 [Kickxella alabastrina]|uniref:Uncharacterized protein n=1 Tax=Kickxella alabastrina TaxID=61397 RepID=A0ACC1HZK8_9FUNG|nr:hypothetical protein LPJ66_012032 [Kickxella alabastrina]
MSSTSIVWVVMRASIATRRGQDYAGFVAPAADTTETLKDVSTHMQRGQMLCITYQAPSEAEPSLRRVFEAPTAFTIKPFTRPEIPHTSIQTLRRVFEGTLSFILYPCTRPEVSRQSASLAPRFQGN